MTTSRVVNLPELSFGAKADSAEAVLVRPGCTFTGYDEDNGRGKSVTVRAPRSNRPKYYPLASKYNPFKSVSTIIQEIFFIQQKSTMNNTNFF